ncbi:hypothetical protein MGG_17964 [Pyricularia oryzae 70-15]|uniref:Uncharacterized protein n=1 Tax=Pyricularia oryzae (strain 70-15 / ATCC MYA-4617 / FGSC 8958) TaxID=242507 RepID=G4NJ06_PYRO7|nr:uncharacterized protein MGG_17964 [Pyricularia oryzae 70-15]EHA46222.1 hypothetical protein MGG_17964 [Pyricularia oryzae 70-15]
MEEGFAWCLGVFWVDVQTRASSLVPSLFGFAWFGQRSRASIHDSSLTGVWTPQCEHSMVPYREILKTLRAPRSSATTSHNLH